MEQNKSYKDKNDMSLIFILIITIIVALLITIIDHNFSIALICWILYLLYSAIHIEVQSNHNKLVDLINRKIEHDKEG